MPDPDSADIGFRLRLARRAVGLNQVQVAEEIGVSVQRWNNYELGTRPANIITMRRFCRRYGISLDWIYEGKRDGLSHGVARRIAEIEAESS